MDKQIKERWISAIDEEYGFFLYVTLSLSTYAIVWSVIGAGAMHAVFIIFCAAVFTYAGGARRTFAGYRELNKDKNLWRVVK